MYKELENIDKLIDGCKRDDRRAQEQLYRSFYESMMNLCVRYTKNETDSKAVLNAGFLKVFRHISKYDPLKATLYTWIRAIVVNCCLDHIKMKGGMAVANELHEAEEMPVEPEISLKINKGEILKLVRNLPITTQAVFNLYIMDGYPHKEIAALLQISEGTSKWHLSEARKNLKQQLEKEHVIK